jgi:hypothetical protein
LLAKILSVASSSLSLIFYHKIKLVKLNDYLLIERVQWQEY